MRKNKIISIVLTLSICMFCFSGNILSCNEGKAAGKKNAAVQEFTFQKKELPVNSKKSRYIIITKEKKAAAAISSEFTETKKSKFSKSAKKKNIVSVKMTGREANELHKGITGINPDAELYSVKVLAEDNKAPVSRVVEGIYWAIDNHMNIINMSFSTAYDSQILRKAIEDASHAGILIIAAAGNNGSIEYPAAYPQVIAVGSVNAGGEKAQKSASGENLELVAPGEKITSSGLLHGTIVESGTSLAAPHVTGVASLLWQKDLSVSAGFIRGIAYCQCKFMWF